MPDREKVISGLQYTIEMFLFDPVIGHSKDPDDLNDVDRITYDACVGAIALLKEQEAKVGEWIEQDDGFGGVYYDCSVCGESWTTIEGTPQENGMKYCPHCGARMNA